MANNGTIVIKFVEGDKKVPGPGPINDKIDTTSETKGDNTLHTAILGALIHRAGTQLKDMVINEAKYQLNLNFSLTDNYMAKQNMSIALGIVNKTAGVVTTIATGATVGGLPGAIIAAGVESVKLGFDIFNNYQQESINIRKSNAQLRFNRERAGYSLTAGSRGENR